MAIFMLAGQCESETVWKDQSELVCSLPQGQQDVSCFIHVVRVLELHVQVPPVRCKVPNPTDINGCDFGCCGGGRHIPVYARDSLDL